MESELNKKIDELKKFDKNIVGIETFHTILGMCCNRINKIIDILKQMSEKGE